jgi:general secretion pathway protein G
MVRMGNKRTRPGGFSLLELLAVVTILGIIAAVIIPRVTVSTATAKQKVRDDQKATINSAVEQFHLNTGNWPANNLSDIGANPNYFPEGLPLNPVDGSPYTLNSTTHRVN